MMPPKRSSECRVAGCHKPRSEFKNYPARCVEHAREANRERQGKHWQEQGDGARAHYTRMYRILTDPAPDPYCRRCRTAVRSGAANALYCDPCRETLRAERNKLARARWRAKVRAAFPYVGTQADAHAWKKATNG